MAADPVEVSIADSCPIVWEWFNPIALEGVDRILESMTATICVLHLCPSWLVKVSWEVACEWILAVINASLREGVVPQPFMRLLSPLFLRGHS